MRIVAVVDNFNANMGYQENYLAREWVKQGHDVFVITSDLYSELHYYRNLEQNAIKFLGPRKMNPGTKKIDGYTLIRLKSKFELFGRPWICSLEKVINEISPEIVNVNGITNFSAIRCARIKDRIGYKLIYDDHMYWGNSKRKIKYLYFIFKATAGKYIKRKADKLIAICHDTKYFMYRNYGFDIGKIDIVPLGADPEEYYLDKKWRKKIREALNIKDEEFVFIYAGKIYKDKKIHLLIDAAIKLLKTSEPFKIVILGYGDNNYIGMMKNKLESYKALDKVIWIDWVNRKELYKYFSAADASVWPGEASISIETAMACGLVPILPYNLKGVKEAAVRLGIAFKSDDVNSLENSMKEIMRNRAKAKNLSYKCFLEIKEKLNWQTLAEEFLK